MAAYTIVFLASILSSQVFAATEVNVMVSDSKISSPANLSYEELVYIIQARNGVSQKPRLLSPCARAILGCCKNNQMDEMCSESLKCGAFFFDDNPCDIKFVLDALKAAKAFYQQLNSPE